MRMNSYVASSLADSTDQRFRDNPLVVGEFGLPAGGALTLAERRAVYAGWFRCARASGTAAAAPWMLANDARPAEWDPHSFYWRSGTDPADPANAYADLVRDAAAR